MRMNLTEHEAAVIFFGGMICTFILLALHRWGIPG